jgi:hypothetical protein
VLLKSSATKILVGAVLIAASAALAHMYVKAQIYHPVIQLASPDGLVFTVVQDETDERRNCGEANNRFIAPIKMHCRQCQVVYARCARELTEQEVRLASGKSASSYRVLSPGLRLAISGPLSPAKQTCDYVAAELVKRGYRTAVCIDPQREAK